jgi:hypothetical protein
MVFLPTTNGLKNATLSIESNDPKMPIRTVDLKGEGVLSETPVRPIAFNEVTYEFFNSEFKSVAIGDVNGDGRADLVVTTGQRYDPENDLHLFVYLQNASGQLDSPTKYPAGYVRWIAIGDLNNDGRNDIVVSVQRGDISVLYGEIGVFYQNQSGQLEPMRIYQTGYNELRRIKIGDFNHDGLLDVVAIAVKQGRFIDMALFFQNQEGLLDPPVSYKAPYYTFDIQADDMNHDGLTDIIVFDSENAEVYFQNSQGLLNMPFFRYMQQSWAGGELAIGDVNGDGFADIVTTNETNRPWAAISVALQNKEGILDPVTWIYPSLDSPNQIAIADVNGDGRQDVIVYHDGWGAMGVFLQDIDGSLMNEKLFGATLNALTEEPLAAGDINGDGFDEIVFLHGNTMSIFYHRDQNPIPKIVDFDGDGKSDIFWQNTDGTLAIWFMDGTTVGSGSGGVAMVPSVWQIEGVGDFDGDGKADILWRHTDGTVAIWFMNGTSVVSGSGGVAMVPSAWQIEGVGDFDGDGKADILWRHTDGTVAMWFMNGTTVGPGSGGFAVVPSVWQIKGVGDFNGDSKADILWQNTDGTLALWFMSGTTVGPESGGFAMVPSVWQIKGIGDFDGDSLSDILWQHNDGTVAIWFMDGTTVGTGSGGVAVVPSAWEIKP